MALVPFIAGLFSRFGSSSSRSAENPAHALGRRGEKLAAAFLKREGFRVLYRNFRSPSGGEVDLVCRDKRHGELVFVEVKTRTRTEFGRPGEAVNPAKQRLIARGALAWLKLLGKPDIRYRFDIVEILMGESFEPEITLLRNAFPLPAPWRD